ncbi:MAG: DUF839 domain-containing protein [Cytophagaceae bacterium]|nr:DUF839 domain-containing protein [Cytophagaceae bacterium]MDW8455299.1 DUF839 domain-containing protein [Cytophagaceae bacterium]
MSITSCIPWFCHAQTIGTFTSVNPNGRNQLLNIPSTHKFQRITRTGNSLTFGGTLGSTLDFTGYIPKSGSSSNGYLSISSETTPAACAIFDITLNGATGLWGINTSGNVNFTGFGSTSRFCSGGVMPWGTVVVSEESFTTGDANGDGYQDVGWHIEIDPATRTVVPKDGTGFGGNDKAWAMGRMTHENICVRSDQKTFYYGVDDGTYGFIFKFVATNPANMSSGTLYVLDMDGTPGTTGVWDVVPNTTKAERNNAMTTANSLGGYNFDGVEDVEIGPDGKVYFTSKNTGRIYRFRDLGATVDQFETYVQNLNYDVDGPGPFPPEAWGTGNDNLAFDGEGNLWVLQDGGEDHIWVVGASHVPTGPHNVRLFATTPDGCEPTGITFTPDHRYLFVSFQNPNATNTASQTDAAGASVVFNTSTTVVIARGEFLGVPLPVEWSSFDVSMVNQGVGVALQWSTTAERNNNLFEIERSENGLQFEKIGEVKAVGNTNEISAYEFIDKKIPTADNIYYRLKQVDNNGVYSYSAVRQISPNNLASLKINTLFPNPVTHEVQLEVSSDKDEKVKVEICDMEGKLVMAFFVDMKKGNNKFSIKADELKAGIYSLTLTGTNHKESRVFIKK